METWTTLNATNHNRQREKTNMTATQTDTTDTTADKLAEMLQENTGRSILDSGGEQQPDGSFRYGYGRHWERNQGVDLEAQPEGQLEFWLRGEEADILATVNVYHFLKDRLEYNEELDDRYREFAEHEGVELWLPSAEAFVESLDGAGGIYGEGDPVTVNTYNGEDLLSQTIQYVYWCDDDGAHVLLQIHGGCDVRGGYTDPVAFDVTDYEGLSIFDNAHASIYCDDCGKHWDTDDSCNWYPDGCCGQGYTELEDYPATDERPDYPERPDPAQRSLPIDLPERPEPCAGVVWVDDDRNGHCPYCGGLLHIAPWPCS